MRIERGVRDWCRRNKWIDLDHEGRGRGGPNEVEEFGSGGGG